MLQQGGNNPNVVAEGSTLGPRQASQQGLLPALAKPQVNLNSGGPRMSFMVSRRMSLNIGPGSGIQFNNMTPIPPASGLNTHTRGPRATKSSGKGALLSSVEEGGSTLEIGGNSSFAGMLRKKL